MRFKSWSRRHTDLVVIGVLCSVSALAYQNCSAGFTSVGGASLASSEADLSATPPPVNNAQGKALYAQNCASCHGPADTSQKRDRTGSTISAAIASVPLMNSLNFLSDVELEMISAAISSSYNPPTQNNQGREVFACTPGQSQKTPLAKLSNREFRASLFSVLDTVSTSLKSDSSLVTLLNNLPTDIAGEDRNTLKEQAFLVTQPGVNGHFDITFRAGQLVAAANLNSYPTTSGCLSAGSITQACHQLFVREFASRAFRRNLTATEGNALAAQLLDNTLSKADLLTLTVSSILSMPDFVYKPYDRGTVVGANSLQLTNEEFATKIAYFLTGAPPDSTLRALATSGGIANAQSLDAELERLLATSGAQETIRRMFRESYGYNVYDSFNYSASYLNGISTSGLTTAMTNELDSYFVEVVLNRRGTFTDLMSSTYTNVSNASLASIYGVSTGATTLPAERAGFLSRASMLTKRSGLTASPIKRGLKVLEHVLCNDVGLPPPSAPTSLPAVTPGSLISTRVRTETLTEATGTACATCHGRINSLGYPFERFDSLGRSRTAESIFDAGGNLLGQVAVNTSVSLNTLGRQPASVSDASDLARQLGQSDRAMMCFVQQLKRFESGTRASSESNCQLNSSLNVLYSANGTGSVRQAIKALITSPEFRNWNY